MNGNEVAALVIGGAVAFVMSWVIGVGISSLLSILCDRGDDQ